VGDFTLFPASAPFSQDVHSSPVFFFFRSRETWRGHLTARFLLDFWPSLSCPKFEPPLLLPGRSLLQHLCSERIPLLYPLTSSFPPLESIADDLPFFGAALFILVLSSRIFLGLRQPLQVRLPFVEKHAYSRPDYFFGFLFIFLYPVVCPSSF